MRHHVLLSIVGIDRIEGGTAHYSGKREQERLIEEGPVPWTIVPATQFHDFANRGPPRWPGPPWWTWYEQTPRPPPPEYLLTGAGLQKLP